jgi:HEAT repeat protein
MDSNTSENILISPDTALLSKLIHEFNIARRNVSSYPKGHPVVTSSCERVIGLFDRLFESRDELTIGVAKDSLVIDGHFFDRLTPFARHFARSLFNHRVAFVTFQKGLTAGEVEKFNDILTVKREQIIALGGIESVFRESGLPNLWIREIRYDDFHVTEDISSDDATDGSSPFSLWESFVLELLRDALPSSRMPQVQDTAVGPEFLLAVIQGQLQHDQLRGMERLAIFLRKEAHRGSLTNRERESFEKIIDFINNLPPELRRHFFERVLHALEGDADPALEILLHLSTEAILEAVQLCEENDVAPPPLLLGVVEKLSECTRVDQGDAWRSHGEESDPVDGPQRKLDVIFRETTGEEFIPVDYLHALKKLIATRNIPAPEEEDLLELKQTLSSDCVEIAVSDIILDSFPFASGEQLEALKRTMLDYSAYFLEIGDYRSIANMYERLRKNRCESGHAAHSLSQEILDTFEETEFIREVLNGLDIWGKEKFHEIDSLIQMIGRPFVEPLLDRLAEEENRTVRRYCLDQLLKLAEQAQESVLARMNDTRWYVVRNLLIILRRSGDPDLAMHLRRVAAHPHPKVRQKVMEMLLQLRDPEGDRLLLDDLSSDVEALRLQAIKLAEKSVHPDIVEALLGILLRKGFSPEAVTEKKAAIRSLAEIGDPRTIPVLEKVLTKWVFFRSSPHLALKKEVVQTLGRYRDPSVPELLVRMAQSRNPELSDLARVQLRSFGRDRE